jgi:Kef-type K+ transport system membrane component KefB
VVTKVVGAGLCARLTGMTWQEAGGLGALLNARGLTELVVLQIGWEAGIIDAALLAVMVVVTLVTTTMAAPLLALTRYPRVVAESRESLPRELAQL